MMNDETARLWWNRCRLYCLFASQPTCLRSPACRAEEKRLRTHCSHRCSSVWTALLNATLFLFTRCPETYRHPLSAPRTTSQTSVCHQNLHVLFNLFCVSRSVSSIHCDGCAIHPSSYKHECITANGRICVHYYYGCGCLRLSLSANKFTVCLCLMLSCRYARNEECDASHVQSDEKQ